MRKLKLQVQITLEGFVAAPAGTMEMFTWDWDGARRSRWAATVPRTASRC